MVYFWGERGIVPFLVTVSAMTILTSWWYARRVTLLSITMTRRETFSEAKGLIGLGLAFMASAVMTNGTTYLIRVMLTREIGLNGLGLYQAAFTLSSLYIGVILTAMGLDYYPRLTAVSANNEACNKLVNQQTEVGLLVAAPGIIATLIFAPIVLQVFYSMKFVGAYGILRWSILGVFLRVLSWPIGYLLLAKGKAMVFFITELAANLVHMALIWGATRIFGLEGTGVAFFGLYIFYTAMILVVGYRFSGFLWSRTNLRLIGFITMFVGAAIAVSLYTSHVVALLCGTIFTAVLTIYCFRKLYLLVGKEWFSGFPKKLKERLRLVKIKSDKDQL
jgi:PST family polysaccharide transporter